MATESGTYTPEVIARRLEMAKALLADPKKPVTHWAEGLNELAKGYFGGKMMGDADRQQIEGEKGAQAARMSLLGVDTAPAVAGALNAPAAPVATAPPAPVPPPAPQVLGAGGQPAAPDAQGVYGADATMMPPPPVTAGREPRGIRNNNPLNIEAGSFTQGQPGFAGSDGRFAKFGSPEQGISAANALLDTYQNKHGLNTVRGIINRWAPSAEAANNTGGYVASVAGRLGIDPDQPLTPEQRPALIQAMSQFENGKPGGGIGAIASALNGAPSGAPTSAPPAAAPPAAAPVAAALNAPAGPAPGPSTDAKARVAAMLRDPNPYVRRQGAALADELIKKNLLKEDPKFHRLNDEQLFDEKTGRTIGAGSGFKALVDPAERAAHGIPADDKRPYQVGPGNKLINPPAETRLNIDQRAEGAYDTAAAKHIAERHDKLVQAGMEAKTIRADVETLKDIGSRITTGKTAQITEALGPYAEALGVKIDGLGDLQAYEAITSKLAPRMRVAGSGATSDYEMKTFLKALPGLGKTPEGNALISNTMEALQDHQEKAAEIGSRALNKEITPREADKLLRELPDPMTAWRKNKGKVTETKPAEAPAAAAAEGGWTDISPGVRIRERK
jgi:hypothetical protein